MMKAKPIFVILGLILLAYISSVLIRSYMWENRAEEYVTIALVDIAKPWNTQNLENRASWGFLEKAKLKPADIVSLAKKSLGNLVEIEADPKCNIQQGFDSYSNVKHTYAVCDISAKFEKTAVVMTIRLQDEGGWESGGWKIINFISIH